MKYLDFQKHHLPKPCMFCPNMAGYYPLNETSQYGIAVHFCHTCQAEYLFYQSGDKASVSLYTEINGKTYRWTVLSSNDATLWWIKEPGIPGQKKNEGLVVVRSFEAPAPQLTPSNVKEKIQLWLPFL